jgi:hypothetical protein
MELDTKPSIHLEWMLENQPQLVRELFKNSAKLEELLQDKLDQALTFVEKLQQEWNMSFDDALEIASRAILAPPDGPAMSNNPPGFRGSCLSSR